MLVWHVLAILAVQALSSGRAAILGYTMPIFSALWGRALFGQRLPPRQFGGIAAAARRRRAAALARARAASPAGRSAAVGMLFAAAVWALGTQQLRRTRIDRADARDRVLDDASLTTLVMTLLAVVVRARAAGSAPTRADWAAIVYNAVADLRLAQAGLAGPRARPAAGRLDACR